MASSQQPPRQSLYPKVLDSNPDSTPPFVSNPNADPSASPSSSLYPSVDMTDLVQNLFPDSPPRDSDTPDPDASAPSPTEETLLVVPGAILHLIDSERSLELSSGELRLLQLRQGPTVLALLAHLGSIQWPLYPLVSSVKLDPSHYFFSIPPQHSDKPSDEDDNLALNYGVTFASKGLDESLLRELDRILSTYTNFSVQEVRVPKEDKVLNGTVAREVAPAEVAVAGPKKDMIEERSAAYWTTLAPNVEEYSGSAAKMIAAGSGQVIKGILWCGDVTVDRLKWGNDFLKKRMGPMDKPAEVSRDAMKRMKRVRRITKMSEKVATGILSGVVKVSGFFTSSIVNSKAGKKFFSLLPGEVVLASLDGFGKICDAVEVAGKNVLSTSSIVTTGIVSHRHGEQAAEITHEGLDAAGHAIGTAWAVFKIRKALNPKNSLKPTTFAKSAVKAAAAELKSKQRK